MLSLIVFNYHKKTPIMKEVGDRKSKHNIGVCKISTLLDYSNTLIIILKLNYFRRHHSFKISIIQ